MRVAGAVANTVIALAMVAGVAAGGSEASAQGRQSRTFHPLALPSTTFVDEYRGRYTRCIVTEAMITYSKITFANGAPIPPDTYTMPLIPDGENPCGGYGFWEYIITRSNGTVESVQGLPVWDKKGAFVGFLEYRGFLSDWILQLEGVDFTDLKDIGVTTAWDWRSVPYNDTLRLLAERTGHANHFDWEGTGYSMFAPFLDEVAIPQYYTVNYSNGRSEIVLGYPVSPGESHFTYALVGADENSLLVSGTDGITSISSAEYQPEQ